MVMISISAGAYRAIAGTHPEPTLQDDRGRAASGRNTLRWSLSLTRITRRKVLKTPIYRRKWTIFPLYFRLTGWSTGAGGWSGLTRNGLAARLGAAWPLLARVRARAALRRR